MPTYEVPVSAALLPELTAPGATLPNGWRSVCAVEPAVPPPTDAVFVRVRVEDDDAPAWTEGQLIEPTITVDYETDQAGHATGNVVRTWVSQYVLLAESDEALAELAVANPGVTVRRSFP